MVHVFYRVVDGVAVLPVEKRLARKGSSWIASIG
jgi:hypothetical protein